MARSSAATISSSLSTRRKLDRRFLDYFIRTPMFRAQVEAQGSTNYAAIRRLTSSSMKSPSAPRGAAPGVARIEELAAQIHEGRALRHHATEETEALVSARTTRVFDALDGYPREPIRTLGLNGQNPVQTGPCKTSCMHPKVLSRMACLC